MLLAAELRDVDRPRPMPMVLEQDIDQKPGRERERRDQEHDGAAGDENFPARHDQLDDERGHGRSNQNGADPEPDIARRHQRRINAPRKDIMAGIDIAVEITRNAQIESREEPERQAGNDGNGERDDQSGAIHS